MYVDDEFQSDLGFIPRRGMLHLANRVGRSFYPKSGIINRLSSSIMNIMDWDPNQDLKKTDHEIYLNQRINFTNQSSLNLELGNRYVYLMRDFDTTRTAGATPLPGDKGYRFNDINLRYQSNKAKPFNFNIESTIGSFIMETGWV